MAKVLLSLALCVGAIYVALHLQAHPVPLGANATATAVRLNDGLNALLTGTSGERVVSVRNDGVELLSVSQEQKTATVTRAGATAGWRCTSEGPAR